MRTRRLMFSAVAGVAVLLAGGCAGDTAASDESSPGCPVATVGALDDDSNRAAYYAINEGIVTSDVVPGVDVSYLTIPAAAQAMGTDQYAYLNSSLPGMLFAGQSGLDVRAVGWTLAHTGGGLAIYARADSGIKTPRDLAGKRVSIVGTTTSATVEAQVVLSEKYGMNPAVEGGDFTWVELDPPTQLNALESGDVDAAILWHQAGFVARNNPDFVVVDQLDVAYHDISGGQWPIGAVVTAQGAYVEQHAECVAEFQRMLTESVAYAQKNYQDLAPKIAAETGVSVEFIDYWWQPDHYQFGGVIDETWNGYAASFYTMAFKGKFLPAEPDLNKIIVEPSS